MPKTLRNTIKNTVQLHLLNNDGVAMGQCLTAVGWVGGTLPELYEEDGMVELPMADVAGSGFVVGAALAGKRPMYVIRYQGFNWFNAPIIINYACKSKEIWNRPCPMFIRSIAMEGGIGPVAGSSHHSLYYRMPGVKIYAPMSSSEYTATYNMFMDDDDVYYVSEHRGSYDNTDDLDDVIFDNPDIILFPISITRFAAIEASRRLLCLGIKAAVSHIWQVKPFEPSRDVLNDLSAAGRGVVIDDDYRDGIAKNLAFDMMAITHASMSVLGLADKTAGFHPAVDNLPPSAADITKHVIATLQDKNNAIEKRIN